MPRYLITGVAGFIGSWLAHTLVEQGAEVLGIDNLSTGALGNLHGILDRMHFFRGDITDEALLGRACRGVDFVFHEAAIASVQRSLEDPEGTHAVNVEGTERLIAAARKAGVKRLVFAASSAAYGEQREHRLHEGLRPDPRSPYARHKLSCERLLQDAWEMGGLETVSLRYFNVYGPRQSASSPYSGVIARFIQQMLTNLPGSPPVIHGDGLQGRDFVYVSDVVEANLRAMHAPASEVAGRVFNIGSGSEQTIQSIFATVAKLTGYESAATHGPARDGDIRSSMADIRAAAKAFDYAPSMPFEEGIRETVHWYQARAGAGQGVVPASPARRTGVRRNELKMPLEGALGRGELRLVYQPIVNLENCEPHTACDLSAAEALLRWEHKDGVIFPGRFVPLAEESGMIHAIGEWVMREAAAQAVRFQEALGHPVRIAVNVSSVQLDRRDFLATVENVLASTSLAPGLLDLEITERIALRDCVRTQETLRRLRQNGVGVVIDDFGVGYSNMNYLYRFPVDRLKIDASFIRHANQRVPLLDAIVSFAQKLSIPTVAEGVETAEQLAQVKRSTCDEAQGYFLGAPMSADSLIQRYGGYPACHAAAAIPPYVADESTMP